MAKTILAVDDSASLRQMVVFSLRAAGYQVTEAADGMEGLEKAKQQVFDLVLTDQNMPHMDGLTLIKSLRALDRTHFINRRLCKRARRDAAPGVVATHGVVPHASGATTRSPRLARSLRVFTRTGAGCVALLANMRGYSTRRTPCQRRFW
jgi:CheY-like chemotaxis protein